MSELAEKIIEIKAEKKSELEKYLILYDLTKNGYFTLDPKGNILELNHRGAKMIGLDKNSDKKKLEKYITHDTLAFYCDFLRKIFETHHKQTCRLSFMNQKNPEVFTHVQGISFDNNTKCMLSAVDISDRDMLKMTALRYRKIFESIKDGILIFDAENGIITDANLVLAEMFGFDSEELMGKEVWELPVFKDIIGSASELADIQNKILDRYSLEFNGKTFDLEITCNVYQFSNKKEILFNLRNINERIKREKELEEIKIRLEDINITKDKFISIMSHDLRSPFNSIIGFSELLVSKVKSKEFEDVECFANNIQVASWHAMELLSNLIEWSRSQHGRLDYKPEFFDFELLIDEVLKYTWDAAGQKSIRLIKKIPENLKIFGDRAMINTVMRNLISNAIKFTYLNGVVTLSAKQENSITKVSVKDDGIGMEPHILGKLFNLGECITTKGTKQETGTGLGLLLCKELLEKHNGNIWVESTPGEGSVFNFTIPN